jgi:hypothetical protein
MLDFYLIDDSVSKPLYREKIGLEFVGGINEKDFELYQSLGLIDKRYDYYSDFRLNSSTVKTMYKDLREKKLESINLAVMLCKAIDKNSGLIAYCD